jgi:hypothetical protein
MQKIIFTFLALTVLFFTGCGSGNEQIDKSVVEKLITDAISGNPDANFKLQGLISENHIGKKDYNQLFIDEIKSGDKTYFSIILEYADPKFNLFAIYDDQLNLYLVDKSLNGYLNSKWIENDSKKFVFLQEQFLTKDVLSVERLSIYEIADKSAQLVYREPSRFVKDNNLAYQRVEKINDDYILTKLTGTGNILGEIKVDTFYFNSSSKKYISKKNLFGNYVDQEINNFIWITTKPQLTEEFVAAEIDTVTRDYKISLGREWEKNPKYIEDRLLKQPLKGVKYSNVSNGSSFIVVQIPRGEEGEKYCPYTLTETVNGNYRLRSSEVFETGNNYIQIFEHTCGGSKYFLLFECPKSIYLENGKKFADIINSFSINC